MDLLANMRKGLASITLTAMASTFMVAPVQAASLGFTDDAEIPSWADSAIQELMDQGVVSGNQDGSFAPNRQLNRAEVSKIIVLSTGIDLDTTGGPHFPDVAEGDWYYDYVETMYNQGWINGYPDGYFRPGVGINRAEIAKMVYKAFELDADTSGAPHFDDVTSGDWFYTYVETMYNDDLMRGYGDGTFGPANPVTRAETVNIVYNSQLLVLAPTGPAEGTLEIVLSDDTPRGTNIPYNATSVPFTTVEMTASDDADVEISSLTFTRLGLGDNDDFDNVWLEIDGFKVGNDKSVNNDDVVELRFNPPIVVPAGQTLVADLVASLDYQLAADGTCFASGSEGCNIGHHNRLALILPEDVVSTAANIAGDFPVEGEEMEVADYRVSEMKFSRLGSDTTVNVGDSFIEIGKFRMLNGSTTNKDVELRALTFKNDGTAQLEDDLENVSLYVSGEQVSAETIIDGDYVTFRLDNGVTGGYIVEDGDSRIFSIRADIVSAEQGDVVNFKIDNFEDVVGVEIGTAFGVKAISGDTNGATFASTTTTDDTSISCRDQSAEDNCARLRAYAIDAGDLNISRDPASLGNQQYAPGSNDVVAMTARLTVDQPIIVDGVRINVLEASNSSTATLLDSLDELNASFDNFRLFLDDSLIDTENDFVGTFGANGVGAYLNFNTTFEISGTSVLKLVANIQDEAATGSQLRLEVQTDAFASPEFISTGDQVSLSNIQGSAQASFVQVKESNLIITRTDGLSNGDRIVAGVNDVSFMKFVLDNNDSGDVNTTSISIQGIGNGAATNYKNFTVAMFVNGEQQGSSRALETDGTATFNDLSVVIPSAAQTEFEIVVDTIEASANSNPANTTLVNGATAIAVVGGPVYHNTTGVVAGAQLDTITFAGTDTGTDLTGEVETVVISDAGGTRTYTLTFADDANSTTATPVLAGPVTTGVPAQAYTVVPAGGTTTVTAGTPGTPFTITSLTNTSAAGDVTKEISATSANTTPNTPAVAGDLVASAGSMSISTPSGTTSALAAGDQVVISSDGTISAVNAEILTVATAASAGATSLTFTTALAQSHGGDEFVAKVVTQYPIGTSVFDVADASKIEVGDSLTIGGEACIVSAVSGNTVTCDFNSTLAGDQGSTVPHAIGDAVIETTTGNNIRFVITAVDADNIENGQNVLVYENTKTLGSGTTNQLDEDLDSDGAPLLDNIDNGATENNENCDIDGVETNATLEGDTNDSSANNFLCGVRFALVQSGQLSITEGNRINNESNILIAGSNDVEVFKLRLSAADDEVEIRDLFFVNTGDATFGDRVDFKLYNESGALVQQKQMTGTTLHFELANQDRIRVPKDDSTVLTLKVDVRSITKANQTGKKLVLALSQAAGTNNEGVEAVTAATGSDLTGSDINIVDQDTVTAGLQVPTSEQYIAYRTMLTFANAAVQPTYEGTGSKAAIFNFMTTNDAAGEGIFNKIVFDVSAQGTTIGAGGYELVRHSSSSYTDGTPTVIATDAAGTVTATFDNFSEDIDGTNYYQIRAIGGYVDATLGTGDDSNISVGFKADAAPSVAATAAGVAGNIVWSDRSNNGGDGQYLNGYEIPMPIAQATGVKQ